MKKISIQTIFVYAIILFWGIPFLKDLLPVKDAKEIIWTCIVLINPIFVAVMSFLFVMQEQEWNWNLPLGLMLCFLPLPFLFYDAITLWMLPIYGIGSFLGMGLAQVWIKKRSS